ncbi:hypothetical protein [Clostridium homopropionicum]|nr:hypothetical protein [Clostridium homopropionicum]
MILWYISKFKRKTIMFLNNRTISDKEKFFSFLPSLYFLAGLALILLGLVELTEVIPNHELIRKTRSSIMIVFGIMYSWVYFNYTDPKSIK